ncbi:Propionate kinase [Citrobacter portucalensis]
MMSLWDALRMNMMIYQELVRTFPKSPAACLPHIEHYRPISTLSPGKDVKIMYK